MGWLKNAWSKLKTKTAMTSETVEAAIHTQMWTAGYSDAEIEFAINDYRESLVSPRLGNDAHLA